MGLGIGVFFRMVSSGSLMLLISHLKKKILTFKTCVISISGNLEIQHEKAWRH